MTHTQMSNSLTSAPALATAPALTSATAPAPAFAFATTSASAPAHAPLSTVENSIRRSLLVNLTLLKRTNVF